ncbi:uncharacterized protein V6R79_022356 [Siganus canaliculatus]
MESKMESLKTTSPSLTRSLTLVYPSEWHWYWKTFLILGEAGGSRRLDNMDEVTSDEEDGLNECVAETQCVRAHRLQQHHVTEGWTQPW